VIGGCRRNTTSVPWATDNPPHSSGSQKLSRASSSSGRTTKSPPRNAILHLWRASSTFLSTPMTRLSHWCMQSTSLIIGRRYPCDRKCSCFTRISAEHVLNCLFTNLHTHAHACGCLQGYENVTPRRICGGDIDSWLLKITIRLQSHHLRHRASSAPSCAPSHTFCRAGDGDRTASASWEKDVALCYCAACIIRPVCICMYDMCVCVLVRMHVQV
jgi:hypothetical protein